ncbi:MAG: hypothetical protein KAY55_05455 [Deltaproteobacteria bacterium]|jgi:hypothetical protein|nr:hypothetical protein [Deltaproteobacteria bacterium]
MQADSAVESPPVVTVSAPAPIADKPRGQLLVSIGLAAGGTTWRSDPLGVGSLALGLRLYRSIALVVQGRLGYGRVDQRQLTAILIGLSGGGYLGERAYGRLSVSFIHQHEESLAAVAEQPAGALLGIGTGIRHRAGVQVGIGCDFIAYRKPKYELTVGPEVAVSYLTYSSGPSIYGFAGIVAGGAFRLF